MKKHLFVLGMASIFALSGCHGISKVDYAKFKEKVDALEEVDPKSVTVSGKLNGSKISKFTYEFPQSAGGMLDSALDVIGGKYSAEQLEAAGHAEAIGAYTIAESKDYTYYTGMGFKVKSENKTVEWNGKGLATSYQSGDTKLSFTWKLK